MSIRRHDIRIIHHSFERLGRWYEPKFVEKSHPEAAIEQVRYRVVGSVIIVDRHPFLGKLRIPCLLRIEGVNIANIVPA